MRWSILGLAWWLALFFNLQGQNTNPGPTGPPLPSVVVKGTGFTPGKAAVINGVGRLDGASGSSSDCLHVDGTSGACGGGGGGAGGAITSVFGRIGSIVPLFGDYSALQISGLAPSATVDTTNAANISIGTLPSGRLPAPGVSSLGGVEAIDCGVQFLKAIKTDGGETCATPVGGGGGGYSTIDVNGTPVTQRGAVNMSSEFTVADNSGSGRTDVSVNSIASGKVSGLATSATTDATNAANISSGTLPAGRLPLPTTSTLGGVKAIDCGVLFLKAINGDGGETCAVPGGGGGGGTVSTVFGRSGAVVATSGDYTTTQVTESGNLYYTSARALALFSAVSPLSYNGSGAFSLSQGGATTGQVLSWNGSAWAPAPAGAGGSVSGVFGRVGAVVATSGDYTSDQVTEGGSNLFFTNARARAALSAVSPLSYNSGTGAFSLLQAGATTGQVLTWNGIGWVPGTVAGGGGGASMASQLGDLNVSLTNSTTLTIGTNCSVATPCGLRFGADSYSLTGSATVTLSGGTGTAYVYFTSAGVLTVGHNLSLGCSITCTAIGSVTAVPTDSIPLFSWAATSGAWNPTGTDLRAFLSSKNVIPGAGLTATESTGHTTMQVDRTTVPLFYSTVGAPGAISGSHPGDLAVDFTNQHMYSCYAGAYPCSTWFQVDGGGGGGGAVSSVFGRSGAVTAQTGDYTAAQVTNAVSTAGSYADPAWITALAWSKLTGAPGGLSGGTTNRFAYWTGATTLSGHQYFVNDAAVDSPVMKNSKGGKFYLHGTGSGPPSSNLTFDDSGNAGGISRFDLLSGTGHFLEFLDIGNGLGWTATGLSMDAGVITSGTIAAAQLPPVAITKTPLTTKGDLWATDGAAMHRLGVGSDGQVLTADSTRTDGLKWAVTSAGGGITEYPIVIPFQYFIQGTGGNCSGISAPPSGCGAQNAASIVGQVGFTRFLANGDYIAYPFVWVGASSVRGTISGWAEADTSNSLSFDLAIGCDKAGNAINSGTLNAASHTNSTATTVATHVYSFAAVAIATTGCAAGDLAYLKVSRKGTYAGNFNTYGLVLWVTP